MDIKVAQAEVLAWDRARGWEGFQPLEVFANMNEEISEIWQKIAWVEAAQKQARAREHREAIEFDVGDLLRLVLTLANQFDVDAERGLARVMEDFSRRHPPK